MSHTTEITTHRFNSACLKAFFLVAHHAAWILKLLRPVIIRLVPLFSSSIRLATQLNAYRLLGKTSSRYARNVIGSFYDFVVEIAQSRGASIADLQNRIVAIEGEQEYRDIRQSKRGAVLVTAHMGSFEVGLAALRRVEEKIHVVFKLDNQELFNQLRTDLRNRLGVTEAPIDSGWPTLVKLRDALARDEVVVMQADRAMPGQKFRTIKLAGGTLRVPVGPITLACINQSPLVPVFTVREPDGRFRVWIEPSINPTSPDADEQLGRVIEKFVLKYPEQWLVLEPVFVEDRERGKYK